MISSQQAVRFVECLIIAVGMLFLYFSVGVEITVAVISVWVLCVGFRTWFLILIGGNVPDSFLVRRLDRDFKVAMAITVGIVPFVVLGWWVQPLLRYFKGTFELLSYNFMRKDSRSIHSW